VLIAGGALAVAVLSAALENQHVLILAVRVDFASFGLLALIGQRHIASHRLSITALTLS